jgi:hypothetical protein
MIYEAFRNGGYGMFPTLAFGLLLLAVAVRYAIEPARKYVPLLLSLGVVTVASGALGFVSGFIKSVGAITLSNDHSPILSLLGAGEAANCIGLALTLVTLAALSTSAGAFRLSRRPG